MYIDIFCVLYIQNRLPDWVAGELGSELSGLSRLSADPSTRSFEEVRERFNDAVGRSPRSQQRYAHRRKTSSFVVSHLLWYSVGLW